VAFDKPSGLRRVARAAGGGEGHPDGPCPRALRAGARRTSTGWTPEASGVVLCARTKPALDFLSGQFQSKTVRKTHHALVVLRPPGWTPRTAAGDRRAGRLGGPARGVHGRPRPWRGRAPGPGASAVLRRRGGKASRHGIPRPRGLRAVRLAGVPAAHGPHAPGPGPPRVRRARPSSTTRSTATRRSASSSRALKRGYKGRESERPLITRLALHAGALGFVHPGSREAVEITSPLPEEFGIALKYLRRFAGRGAGSPLGHRVARGRRRVRYDHHAAPERLSQHGKREEVDDESTQIGGR
jgi:23S rRNA pseudouridine1911/1915/1917 synthase